MELFKNVGIMKITKDKLAEMILKSLNERVEEGKLGRAMAGLGLAATLATSMPSCSYFDNTPTSHYEPHWEHEGPYSEQEKQEKTWNTHQERGDWENIEPGVGFIYDCYTRCANSGGGWTIHVIFADKSTGKFILPQHPEEYLFGRYMPNCNCFENENTTDRVNTNGLQRLDGSENITVFENRKDMKQVIKLNESQLRNMIREAINEIGDTEKGQEALGALHAKKVYDKYRDDYKKTGKACGHVRTDDEARVLNYAVDKQSKSKDPVGMKSAYDNGYVKQRDKENAKGISESKLDGII